MLELCNICRVNISSLCILNSTCISCLGNDHFWSTKLPEEINKTIKNDHYHPLKTFNLNITLPICHEVRHFLIELYIKQHQVHPLYNHNGSSTWLKSTIRRLITEGLKPLVGLRDDSNSSFHINILITSTLSNFYCEWMWNWNDLWKKFPTFPKHLKTKDINLFKNMLLKSRVTLSCFLTWIHETIFKDDIQESDLIKETRIKLLNHLDIVLRVENEPNYLIELLHDPIYLAGRYTKNARNISQSPWIESSSVEYSVSSIIGDYLKEKFMADDYRFSSAGREDIDVRMLGDGRPCLFQVINPRMNIQLINSPGTELCREWSSHFTGQVLIHDLINVKKDIATKAIKEGEETKKKIYLAIVMVPPHKNLENNLEKLNQLQNMPIILDQKTPIRVLQRRPNLIRTKNIYKIHGKLINSNESSYISLLIYAEAGTYIKEFVHGDYGRTVPSLANLLSFEYNDSCKMISLDVLHVDGFENWPYFAAIK